MWTNFKANVHFHVTEGVKEISCGLDRHFRYNLFTLIFLKGVDDIGSRPVGVICGALDFSGQKETYLFPLLFHAKWEVVHLLLGADRFLLRHACRWAVQWSRSRRTKWRSPCSRPDNCSCVECVLELSVLGFLCSDSSS